METYLCVIYKYFQDFLVKMFSASYNVNKQDHIRFLEQINKKHNIHTIIILINETNVTITTTLSA